MNTQQHNRSARPRRRSRILAAVAVLALSTLGLGTSTASAAAAPATTTTKLTSAVAGTVAMTGPTTFALSGAGAVLPVGTVKYSGSVVVTSAPGATTLTDVLTETLTTANGDSITLLCQQSATPVGTTGILHGTDRWVVTAGTGRFRNATGSGTGDTYIYNLQAFAKTGTGTITY